MISSVQLNLPLPPPKGDNLTPDPSPKERGEMSPAGGGRGRLKTYPSLAGTKQSSTAYFIQMIYQIIELFVIFAQKLKVDMS
jgi:hypothetical protein